ncbi:MAG: TrkH family potassium uptake protein [Oscillospiraceae bacterium]
MNYKLVCKLLGMILCIEAACMLPSLGIAAATGDGDVAGFALSMALCAVLGGLLYHLKTGGAKMQPRDGFAIVALGWLLLSAFGALPYVFSGAIPNYIDAFFETVSGFTTTGASVLTEIESLPRGILFWRAFTQWMGGMGVLVLTLALLPKIGEGSIYLMKAESPGPAVSKLTPRVRDTAKLLYAIYFGLTIVEVICLCLAGMPLFDALTNSFTTISTGGFCIRNTSVAAYGSELINWIIILFMFLSGINFAVLFAALCGRFHDVFHSDELRLYTGIAVGATLLISFNLFVQRGVAFTESVSEAAFQVVSLMTTTGFVTADYDLWPTFAQTVLILVMLAGACAGSTAGGVKSIRLVLLLKSERRELRKVLHPREVHVIRADGHKVEEDTLVSVQLFFFAYMLILLVATLIVAWDDIGFTGAFSATLTSISNVGPGLGAVGPTDNFSILSPLSKVVLSICMLLGRLEILPILVLLFPSLWKKK